MQGYVLIVGMPGSGKTHLAAYFKKRGKNAYDADEIKGLGKWIDKNGRRVRYNHSKADQKWIQEHKWIWSGRKLRSVLRHNKNVFLFGTSSNVYGFVHLFDKAYYLKASPALISSRLQHIKRTNSFGKTDAQRESILERMNRSYEKARRAGFTFIDASMTPRQILKRITERD